MKGGYRILSFAGRSFRSGQAAKIAGIYENTKNEYKKATLVSGLRVGTTLYEDVFVPFINDDNTFRADFVIGTTSFSIEIENNDNVTVTVGEE